MARDNRLFVEAVLCRHRAGIPWRDLPIHFSDFREVHTRLSRWSKTKMADNEYGMIDSTIVRVHQHSAGAKGEPEAEAIGRSKGGVSPKIHAVVNALGYPCSFHLNLRPEASIKTMNPKSAPMNCSMFGLPEVDHISILDLAFPSGPVHLC